MKITKQYLTQVIKEEIDNILQEGQTKTVQSVIDRLAADDARRSVALPDLEACAKGHGDPGVKKFYPGWTRDDFDAVVKGLKKLGKA